MDTDEDADAPFVAKYKIEVWPTLLVVDAAAEAPVLRWQGSATVAQLEKLLDDGERAVRAGDAGADAEALVLRADKLAADGNLAEARTAYLAASDASPSQRRPRIAEALVNAEGAAGKNRECTDDAVRFAPSLPPGAARVNVVAAGLYCAAELVDKPALATLLPVGTASLATPDALADDISGLYEALVEAKKALGDDAGARATGADWFRFVDDAAAKAGPGAARSPFDSQFLFAARAAGDPSRALAPLARSERENPGDYNPPYRLGQALRDLGRFDDAIAAFDRALARAYGANRIAVRMNRALAEAAKGDKPAAHRDAQAALALAEASPGAPHRESTIAQLHKILDETR